jgi:prepilin-type N-terminal cleavage/methylation domain-containing protein
MWSKEKAGSKGFTLIEVQIAIFVLVVAIMGLSSMTVMVIKGNSFSKCTTKATALANDKMEDLKSRSFTDASFSAGAHSDAGNPIQGLYTRTWSVTDGMDASNTQINYKTIAVTVTWNGQDQTRTVSLNALQANPG